MNYDALISAVERETNALLEKSKSILTKAQEEGRSPSEDERAEIDAQMRQVDVLKAKKSELESDKALLERVDSLGASIRVNEPASAAAPARAETAGEIFTKSDGYKRAVASGFNGRWSTGAVEVKATLVEGGGQLSEDVGTSGAAAVGADIRPGILPILFQPLTVADLLGQARTSSNLVRYVQETTADAGDIGIVHETGPKPEAELEFDVVDEPVLKIASFLPVADEMLEDADQIRSYIDARLSLFVRTEEENQLLNGAGSGDIDGLLSRVASYDGGSHDGVTSDVDAAQSADHIYHAISLCRQDGFMEPDAIVINPEDWEAIQLLKTETEKAYMGPGPFAAAAGPSLWGKRVVVTSAMSPGEALVGAFGAGAAIYRRGGLTVEASNSHEDFFKRNMTAIRAEERFALAVYRPGAFATADLSGS